MWRRIFQPNVFPRNRYQSTSTLCHRFYGTCLSMISTNTFPHNKNSIILPVMKPALELVRPVCLRRRLPKIYPQITIIRKLHRQLRSLIQEIISHKTDKTHSRIYIFSRNLIYKNHFSVRDNMLGLGFFLFSEQALNSSHFIRSPIVSKQTMI